MTREDVLRKIGDMEELAREKGLDFFPVIFEFVSRDMMLEACSYGLIRRARHWSYGKSYDYQRLNGRLGRSKVYEIVFNNDPAIAFMMDTNPDIVNVMVAAHVFGHSHFFKNNVMFQGSDRNMISNAAERASRVDQYVEEYGIDRVEHLMDIGLALDNHIDWNKGRQREKYPAKRVVERQNKVSEFEDLLNIGDYSKRSITRVVEGAKFPPHPEQDLLWFLINYAPIEEWEKDILGIIREESYYFYCIGSTKVINEGSSVFWHSELMMEYEGNTEEEYLEFCKLHSSVVSPGDPFNINPYYLGFKIFTDIRERWDKLHAEGKSDISGFQKVLEVSADEDDESFLRNYLTKELAQELGLFNYGYKEHRDPDIRDEDLSEEQRLVEIKDRDLNKIIEHIVRPMRNYGAPMITIAEVDGDVLIMDHSDKEGPLDEKYTKKTLEYIYELWGAPVELNTHNYDKDDITCCYDESGYEVM